MPVKVLRSPRAKRDLLDIWFYTADRWGEEQADKYLRKIADAIDELADEPHRGVDFDHIRRGIRRLTVDRHRVFYRVRSQMIDIVRILHERMDFDAALPD